MNVLNNVNGISGLRFVPDQSRVDRAPGAESNVSSDVDRVELSGQSPESTIAPSLSDIRAERIARVRAQIAEGTYDTELKVSITAGKVLAELSRVDLRV
jgi:anti-sigma28 factor (negative regulator of flagellin synthesis)